MTIDELYDALSAQAGNGQITLDTDWLSADEVTNIHAAFGLTSDALPIIIQITLAISFKFSEIEKVQPRNRRRPCYHTLIIRGCCPME